MIGQTLGHFRIVEKIGAGGMGVVYRAHDEQLDRDVAIKVLPAGALADDAARKRFRQEALALSKLNHPNIATLHEFASEAQVDYLVMEYVAGTTMSDRLTGGPLPEKETLRLGAQLAEGLAAAHEHDVVHRDLKPGNLRVTPDGRLKILDFGLAKLQLPEGEAPPTESLTQAHVVPGTLPYMSPEQASGEPPDSRSDLYAAGAVLYEMSTGRRPFPGDRGAMQLLNAILHEKPRPPSALNPRISAGLEGIILKCLEKDPEHRYQSAREILADLRRLGAGSSVVAVRTERASPRSKTILVFSLSVAAAVALAFVGGWWRSHNRATSTSEIHSLAVLPFANLSHDPEQEYFVDGMTDSLITNLGQIGALRVISRTSAMAYKNARKTVPEIARELHVDAVMDGSVSREGDRVLIRATLIQASPERTIWTQQFQRGLRDVLALQNEVAQKIAEGIQVQLTPQESARLSKTRTVDPQAYEAYLLGRHLWSKRTPGDLRKAMDEFKKAIHVDPGYALAWAGLADSYSTLSVFGELPPREAMPQAKEAAQKALDIDPTLAEAQACLANIESAFEWKAAAAEKDFRKALALNPNYASARQWYAVYLSSQGRHDEAIAQIEWARELDPLSFIIEANVGMDYYYARRYGRAISISKQAEERDPGFWVLHSVLGQVYLAMGQLPSATSELEQAASLSPDSIRNKSLLGRAYAAGGRRREAQRVLDEMQALSGKRYVSPAFMAIVYAGLPDKDKALAWLEKAYTDRSDWMILLNTEPLFDPLRSDPRFRDLVRRVGFQP